MSKKQAKILIVDDDVLILKAFKRLLELEGHIIETNSSGRAAIEIAKSEKFDVVYTDLVMPDINGVEVCKEIKKISPSTEIVLISGHPSQIAKYKLDFIRAGGREEFLRKPVMGLSLLEKTESILSEKNGNHANLIS